MCEKKKNPLVSVIVPVYKVEKYLDECIFSIVNQTYKKLEIILIDDGSPDTCPARCDIWARKDKRILVIHKSNGGVSDAREIGIKKCKGDLILFVDSDDVISLNMIELMINVYDNNENSIVAVGYKRFNNEISGIKSKHENVQVRVITSNQLLKARNECYYCWGILYNKNLIVRWNLCFDTTLRNLEDVVWNAIYFRFVSNVYFIDSEAYGYRSTPFSITSYSTDKEWQAKSWFLAYESIIKKCDELEFSRKQIKEIKKVCQMCLNNLHAELNIGNIDYSFYNDLLHNRKYTGMRSCEPVIHKILQIYMPRVEYWIYKILLKIKLLLYNVG